MVALGTLFPIGFFLPQYNTDLECHSWFHRAPKFRRTNETVIFSAYDFIVTSLDEVVSDRIPAMALDNIIEILGCDNVQVDRYEMK
jgi:hypothetical protein